jgi:hypothetical protein
MHCSLRKAGTNSGTNLDKIYSFIENPEVVKTNAKKAANP